MQVKLGTDGKVSVFNGGSGPVDIIGDVMGFYAPGGATFLSTLPTRFTDRQIVGGQPFVAVFQPPAFKGRVYRAVAQNVTIDQPAGDGWVRAYPSLEPAAGSSNLNFLAGQTVANAVLVGTSSQPLNGEPGRAVAFSIAPSVTSARLIIDDRGIFIDPDGTDTGKFVPITPCRVADTRVTPAKRLSAGTPVTFAIAGACDLPPAANIDSVAINVTAVNPTATAFVRVWGGGDPQPAVSTLNVKAGQIVANHAIVYSGASGNINALVNAGTTDLIIDVSGYYST